MGWFKVDDKISFHRKVLAAGNAAMGAWLRMGAHSACHETDGFVSDDESIAIGSRFELNRLVAVSLLERVKGGYVLHDYLKYNPSKQELDNMRQRNRERVQAHRARNADVTPSVMHYSARSNDAPTQPIPLQEKEEEIAREAEAPSGSPPADAGSVSAPKRKRKPAGEPSADALLVFQAWVRERELSGLTHAVQFSPGRVRAVERALKTYTVAQLERACCGCLRSRWHLDNGQTDLELIARNAEKTDRFLALADKHDAIDREESAAQSKLGKDYDWRKELLHGDR